MKEYIGKVLHTGIAVGKIHIVPDRQPEVERRTVPDHAAEEQHYLKAKQLADAELLRLKEQAAEKIGQKEADIFEAQIRLLGDPQLSEDIRAMIRDQGVCAEFAVFSCIEQYRAMFSRMENEYFSARSADLADVEGLLVRILSGASSDLGVEGPCIIMASDLLPSQTLQLDRRFLLAFVTREGSPLSHTAILARSLDIPALCRIPVDDSWNGHMAVVDGKAGKLILDPEPYVISLMEEKKLSEKSVREKLRSLVGRDSVTSDGKPIRLYANIGRPEDIPSALENDAEGIGLFRTEFLYLGRQSLPDEEEQFETYRSAALKMSGRPLIIRTIDLGADKQSRLLDLQQEKNPALGFRGVRICLERPALFRPQLRAILRASVYGDISIMFPMITSVSEVRKIKEVIKSVKEELTEEKIPWKECPLGIMIETPSAALLSAELAREVDFFSIGTNDLTQYTLAMDRQNGSLDSFYDPYSEAVMKEIAMTVKNGHRFGCLVGICGELAADTTVTDRLLKMGVDELSVSPHMVLPVRKAILESCTDPDPAAQHEPA